MGFTESLWDNDAIEKRASEEGLELQRGRVFGLGEGSTRDEAERDMASLFICFQDKVYRVWEKERRVGLGLGFLVLHL